jgi:hypothetical protein
MGTQAMRVPPVCKSPLAGGKAPPRIHCSNNGGAALTLRERLRYWLVAAMLIAMIVIVLTGCQAPLR